MQEATVFAGAGSLGAPLQSVQHLLAGDGLQAGYVAEGVDGLTEAVRNLAGQSLVADAAAVHDGEVHVQTHVVKQIVQSVSGEVAGVGLLLADQTVAVGVVVVEGVVNRTDDFAQQSVHFGNPGVLNGLDFGIGFHGA